jgi:O-methyltransferase involved in polyketide biosynthesis
MEAKKKRAVVRDTRALELMNVIDFDFGVFRRAYGTQIGCVLRGLLYDAWVSAFLDRHPKGTVVELGAGLSTRFERIDNGLATWIDVDLPHVIAMRRRYFHTTSRRVFVSASVLGADWSARIAALAGGPYFFICEGMLMYLDEAEVRRTLVHVADVFPDSYFAFDSIACAVVRHQRHHDSMKHMMDVPFRWGIDDVREIGRWDGRVKVNEVATLAEIARRFRERVPMRYRVVGELVSALCPSFDALYRLSLLRLSEPRRSGS